MVKDHSNSKKGNPLPPHRLLLSITARVILYAPSHRQDSTYHGLCYTSRGALAGTRNSSMGPPHEGSIRRSYFYFMLLLKKCIDIFNAAAVYLFINNSVAH